MISLLRPRFGHGDRTEDEWKMSTGQRKNPPARSKTSPAAGQTERSQVMELFLALAAELGFTSDEDVAR